LTFGKLVSVVVPVYNSAKFLDECIDSILAQTYENIEVIAVDDGSTDESLEILNNYSDKILVLSQENKGLSSALNWGISTMKGQWFKWFSPDDIMYPNAIETLVNETKNNSLNTILYSNWEIIDEDGKKLSEFHESNYNTLTNFEYNVRLLDGQLINVNTTLIPSTLFKKNCLIRNLSDPIALDYDFFLRAAILFNTKFQLIPKNLIKYRIHSNQLSHKNILQSLSYLSKIKNQILDQLSIEQKENYITALKRYNKEKPLIQKTLKLGLQITSIFPSYVSDQLLTLYLNKIRRTR